MDLQSQFDAAKAEVPVGWHWMLDILFKEVDSRQKSWLKVNGQSRWAKPDKPFFDFTLANSKQKFGAWRNYVFIDRVEHDWDVYSKEEYDKKFLELNSEIHGIIGVLEHISSNFSEASKNFGTIRNIRGWMAVLTDEEYDKIS